MERIESKRIMRGMRVGEVASFPIVALETVRNNVALLNAKHYREGRKWASISVKEEGIVRVRRIS